MAVNLARATSLVRVLSGTDISSLRGWWFGSRGRDADDAAGPRANRQLTALAGAVVLPVALVALLTGLFFGDIWRIHFFVGYLLLPLAALKLGSTTYRLLRYYLRSGVYRVIRPPYPLGRLNSPLLASSVVMLLGSGIVMWATHSQRDPWGFLHTDAAIAFSVLAALHLAMYLPEAPCAPTRARSRQRLRHAEGRGWPCWA
jgi:hypothetical protein